MHELLSYDVHSDLNIGMNVCERKTLKPIQTEYILKMILDVKTVIFVRKYMLWSV